MKTKFYVFFAGLYLATIGIGLSQPCSITINNQPQAQANCIGTTVTTWVAADGTAPLSYQWQRSGDQVSWVDVPEATNNTIVITNFQAADVAYYRVVVTNAECSVASQTALLSPLSPPAMSSFGQPTNWPVLSLGVNLTNRALATGTAPLSYQWRFNGEPLPGETKYIIILTNIQVANTGQYEVVLTNICGSITSRVVSLDVDPTYTQITNDPLVNDTAGGWNACWIDYDGDGHLDVSVAPQAGALRYTPIYHNEGNGKFRKVLTNLIAQAQVNAFTHTWADYDNDGKPDLFVPNTGSMNDMLFHNEGNGVFTRITTGHPVIDASNTKVGAWADYDRDGFLDLCADTPCQSLYRNNGDGTFRKMTQAEVGPIADCLASDYILWVDVDNDGWPDLYRNAVPPNLPAGWSMTNHVYRFDSLGMSSLMDLGELKRGTEGYATIVWADYDNDGLLDALSGAERGPFKLYRNLGVQGFTNVTANAILSPQTNTLWGTVVDYDNDGWQDMLMYNWAWTSSVIIWLRNNGDGTFTRQYVGSPSTVRGQSGYFGDYDNDGFLDLLVIYGPGIRNSLYRHNGNSNHWLKVKLDGRASNRSGIGAKVRVLATIGGRAFWQLREISGQGGVCVDNGLLGHFGLGDATNVATLRIEWPSGIVQELQNVPAHQFTTVVESQGYTNMNAIPKFVGAAKIVSGTELTFSEPATNARYILEASTNLVTWTKLLARTSTGAAAAQFTDSRATNYTKRFYRVVVP